MPAGESISTQIGCRPGPPRSARLPSILGEVLGRVSQTDRWSSPVARRVVEAGPATEMVPTPAEPVALHIEAGRPSPPAFANIAAAVKLIRRPVAVVASAR